MYQYDVYQYVPGTTYTVTSVAGSNIYYIIV